MRGNWWKIIITCITTWLNFYGTANQISMSRNCIFAELHVLSLNHSNAVPIQFIEIYLEIHELSKARIWSNVCVVVSFELFWPGICNTWKVRDIKSRWKEHGISFCALNQYKWNSLKAILLGNLLPDVTYKNFTQIVLIRIPKSFLMNHNY